MTCRHGPGLVVCTGASGPWVPRKANCPWCCVKGETTPHLSREVFGGYCAPDMICAECGHRWNAEGRWWVDTPDEDRAANREMYRNCTEPPTDRTEEPNQTGYSRGA